MRLMWLKSDYIIPPDTGGKIRTYNLMRGLRSLCELSYVALRNTPDAPQDDEITKCAQHVSTYYQPEEIKSGAGFYLRVLAGMISSLPYIVRKYISADIKALQAQYCDESDEPTVILCDFLEMAENVDFRTSAPKVLFQHNVESMIWRRYFENETNALKKAYFNYEAKRMAEYEKNACNKFDLVFVVSESDKQILRDEFKVTSQIEVIETGVDTEYFAPQPEIEVIPKKLVFTGSMDWMPNIDGIRWFVGEVYPLIKAATPDITLDIVGRRPTAEVSELANLDSSITVTGGVPDVRPYLAHGDIFIVPLRIGGGTRIKIFEALAMAKATVSTTIGAEGLPLEAGKDILLGDTPTEFASQVNQLLEYSDIKNTIASNGFTLVVENYRWEKIAQNFHQQLMKLTDKSVAQSAGVSR